MCHSYDVIKLLSKYITYDSGVFIPVSIGAKSIKMTKNARVIVKNKVAPFYPDTVYFVCVVELRFIDVDKLI